MAQETVQEGSSLVEEQVKKTGELISGANKAAGDAANSGLDIFDKYFFFTPLASQFWSWIVWKI